MRQKLIEKNLFKKNCGNVFKTFQLRRRRNALILFVSKTQIKKITFYVAIHDNFKTSYEKKSSSFSRIPKIKIVRAVQTSKESTSGSKEIHRFFLL